VLILISHSLTKAGHFKVRTIHHCKTPSHVQCRQFYHYLHSDNMFLLHVHRH
jgi:hypothetical protein